MRKTIRHLFFLALFALALSACFSQDAQAADVAVSNSTISCGGASVDPYQSFSVTIALRDSNNANLSSAPGGKIYIWASDENDNISDGLDVVLLSLGDKVYVHQTGCQGVLIMDAASLSKPQSFNLTLDTKGSYTLHALYISSGSIDPSAISNYWPYELSGNNYVDRSVTVGSTPANDVAMMVVSTKIHGIGVDSFVIYGPRNRTTTTPISVEKDTATEVTLTLLHADGRPVGEGVAVYLNTTSNNVTVSNVYVTTDTNGRARFTVRGLISDDSTLQLHCGTNDSPVTIPLSTYEYKPERIRMDIGTKAIDVDGRTVAIDTAAVIRNGRTYVPFRAISELLGAEISYDSSVRTITTNFNDSVLTMTVDYNHYAVDGTVYQMDAAPYVNSDGRTMVPLRFIAQFIGYDVQAVSDSSGKLTRSVVLTRN